MRLRAKLTTLPFNCAAKLEQGCKYCTHTDGVALCGIQLNRPMDLLTENVHKKYSKMPHNMKYSGTVYIEQSCNMKKVSGH